MLGLSYWLSKDCGIEFREKRRVQPLDYARHILFSDHECQIYLRGALRDHAHVDVANRRRRWPQRPGFRAYSRRPGTRSPCALHTLRRPAYQDRRQSAGIASFESTVSDTLTSEVETTSTAHFVAVEYFKDRLQESVRHQHSRRGHDLDDGDALFGGDGFENVRAARRARGDAWSLRSPGCASSTPAPGCSSGPPASTVAGCSTLAPK